MGRHSQPPDLQRQGSEPARTGSNSEPVGPFARSPVFAETAHNTPAASRASALTGAISSGLSASGHADSPPTRSAEPTPAQRQAIVHVNGPLLVLAAAGSGKTLVITRRMANLIAQGVPPWAILGLTFTNKAAGEMRRRVEALVPHGTGRGLTVSTFHSFCAGLLRRYADQVRLSADYSIYGMADQKAAVKLAVEKLDYSTSNFPPDRVLAVISNAKNALIGPAQYRAEATDFFARCTARIYEVYTDILHKNDAADFDDLLLHVACLLRDSQEIRSELQERFRYLLIDEYQDTNHAQFIIAHALAAKERNICVVGDPDQSIYGWRGADISNILEFQAQYPEAKTIKLGENFRSTAPILALADHLIKHNKARQDKPLFTTRDGGELPVSRGCEDEHEEAKAAADFLANLEAEHGIAWRDMAVFYRTNALSRVIEAEFIRRAIPYTIVRGTAFYDRKEIKEALLYLRVILNPHDDIALKRIVNTPARGIGQTTLKHVELFALQNQLSLLGALDKCAEIPGLSARAVPAIGRFADLMNRWRGETTALGDDVSGELTELVARVIADSGLEAFYGRSKREEDTQRVENLRELVSSATDFETEFDARAMNEPDPFADPSLPLIPDGSTATVVCREASCRAKLRAYLESVALISDVDALDREAGSVMLMTLHATKGLEFTAVAMIGLEEGLLPHSRSRDSEADVEEERRLCFVGITRTKEYLLLTHAAVRAIRGIPEPTIASRFLDEMPNEHLLRIEPADIYSPASTAGGASGPGRDSDPLVNDEGSICGTPTAQASSRRGTRSRAADALEVGCAVRHPQFGIGRVESISRMRQHTRVKIAFTDVGTKTLIAEYARLQRLDS